MKYRLRDKKTNQLLDKEIPVFLTADGRVLMESNAPIMSGNYHIDDVPCEDITNTVDVEFATGRFDKKGEEIFQGDTISAFDGVMKALIVFKDSMFQCKWLGKTAMYRQREIEPIPYNTNIIYEIESSN